MLQRAVKQSDASTRELQRVNTRLDDLARHVRVAAAAAPAPRVADASQRDQQESAHIRDSLSEQRQDLEALQCRLHELAGSQSAHNAEWRAVQDTGTSQHAALQVRSKRVRSGAVALTCRQAGCAEIESCQHDRAITSRH